MYLPYDMDNTFGVQWGFNDINKRDIYNWGSSSSAAPLTKNILSHTQYRRDYEFYIKNLLQDAWHRDSLYAELDYINQLIQADMKTDPFFDGTLTNDYGFTFKNWQESYTSAWGNHVSFGIKPYIYDRSTSALSQFKFANVEDKISSIPNIYPNPSVNSELIVRFPDFTIPETIEILIFDIQGKLMLHYPTVIPNNNLACLNTETLKPGNYIIKIGNYVPLKWVKLP
jgi:hypothetical protein